MEVRTPLVRRHTARVSRFSFGTETAGLSVLLLGAWAGIIPFVGPSFGFSGDGSGSWHWNLSHALLFLVPGAAAFVAGVMIMLGDRALRAAAGLLAAAAGAWLVVGPVAWLALEGSSFFVVASPVHEFAYWIGYSLGPGGLLIGLGAFVLGRIAPMRVVTQVSTDPAVGATRSTTEEVPDQRMVS